MAGRKPIYDHIIQPMEIGDTIERVNGVVLSNDTALTIARRAALMGRKLSRSTSKLTKRIVLTRIE